MGIISVKKLALEFDVDNFKILETLKYICAEAKEKGFSDLDGVLHMNFEDDGQAFIDYWVNKGYDSVTYHNEPIPPMIQDKIRKLIPGIGKYHPHSIDIDITEDEAELKTEHVKLARQQKKEDESKKDKLGSSQDDNQKDEQTKDEQIEDIADPKAKGKSIPDEIAKLKEDFKKS